MTQTSKWSLVVQRDYPIGAHIVTRSTTHIKGSKTGVHTIPRAHVEEEEGDTEEEIDICGHIFHTLKKTIKKQHSRTVMPFPSLIMRSKSVV